MARTGYGRLPFSEQIAFFRRKRNVLTESWLDVFGAEHDTAFMVAGANRDDLLADLREAVRKAIEEGATLEQFRIDFDRIVARYGWDYTGGRNWRTRIIYETNLRQSYNAGQWAQIQRAKRARPYLRYRHNDSVQYPRPIHEGWDGLILHVDDPWWHTHFPANGWGCQCYVESLAERDLRRMGKSGPDTAPPVNMVPVTIGQRSPGGPRTVMTPEGIDPGFGYAPGRSLGGWPSSPTGPVTPPASRGRMVDQAQRSLRGTGRLPAQEGADSAGGFLGLRRVRDALVAGLREWLQDPPAQQAGSYLVGAIAPTIVRAMTSRGAVPAAAAIGIAAPSAAGAALPSLLADPVAVLLEQSSRSLLYVVGPARSRRVLRVDTSASPAQAADAALDLGELRRRVRSGDLELLQGKL